MILQITAFLVSATALLFLLWFIFRLYAIEKMNALVDPLTEIYNRRAVMLGFKNEIERAKKFGHHLSVAIIDIDYFKKYNDTNGHVAGDKILKKVVKVVGKSIRETDLLGRVGGEEFLIIFPETSHNKAFKICERVRANVEKANFPFESGLPTGKLTISVGVAEFSPVSHLYAHERLIEDADKQLYIAKLAGRNTVR